MVMFYLCYEANRFCDLARKRLSFVNVLELTNNYNNIKNKWTFEQIESVVFFFFLLLYFSMNRALILDIESRLSSVSIIFYKYIKKK